MKILGYIVTSKKLKNIKGFVGQVNDIELADPSKPILIVGWKNAKKHPNYKSVLDKQIGENLYWTFSRNESRSDFEEDINKFYDIIYNNISNNINYYYVNIFKLKYNKIKKLYNIIYSTNFNNIYISENMVYIPYNGNVLGLSLNIIEYYGISKEKVIEKIKSNPNNKIINDSKKAIFTLSKCLGNKKYVLPYFIDN